MKVLFVALRLPYPPHRGDRLHIAEMLRTLSTRHEVTLVTLTGRDDSRLAHSVVSSICRTVTVPHSTTMAWLRAIAGQATPLPSQVLFCHSNRMHEAVLREAVTQRPDIVIAHTIRMAQYVQRIEGARRILLLCDAMGDLLAQRAQYSPFWMRPALLWERSRLDRYTAKIRPRFDDAWVFSPTDQTYEHAHGCPDVRVVRHGVSQDCFEVRRSPDIDPLVMFLGNLSVAHNIDAAQFAAAEVFPLLRKRIPTARLLLAGADPTRRIRELGNWPGITVPGMVPDMGPLWARTMVFLAPVRYSAGIQNKVLEAAAAAVPVVTTPRVAKGIGLEPGVHALVASDAAGLASAVVETIENPAQATERARQARRLIHDRFRWDSVLDALG